MRKKRPHPATLDEVRISRDGEDAIIEFVDTTVATMNLKLGREVHEMTDHEILNQFNAVMRAQQQMVAEYKHVAIEVPPGRPQIKYFEPGDQWVPRGAVLRCLIDDDEDGAVITIDDRELSTQEFGRLLNTYAGWGMRIVFVPEDEIDKPPHIEVREPDDDDDLDPSDGKPFRGTNVSFRQACNCEFSPLAVVAGQPGGLVRRLRRGRFPRRRRPGSSRAANGEPGWCSWT